MSMSMCMCMCVAHQCLPGAQKYNHPRVILSSSSSSSSVYCRKNKLRTQKNKTKQPSRIPERRERYFGYTSLQFS